MKKFEVWLKRGEWVKAKFYIGERGDNNYCNNRVVLSFLPEIECLRKTSQRFSRKRKHNFRDYHIPCSPT